MKFSIFTPSHDPTYLNELYASLQAQTCADWEWVIALNGNAIDRAWDEPNDDRVEVRNVPKMVLGVGALKAWACNQCRGDYLVEVDHDDLLTPDALDAISHAIDMHHPDFLYSDCVEFRADDSSNLYGVKYGWEHYDVWLRRTPERLQKKYTVNRSFLPTAASLSQIFYAPNHIRVWKRSIYEAVGGHDPRLEVCDDFDLVCRTYLAGAKFHYIPQCLYLYRLQADRSNTYLKRNADIQKTQQEIGDKYRHRLVNQWCINEALPRFDLGGGKSSPDGYTNLDLQNGVDIVIWLRQRNSNSVGCFRAFDMLEHIPHCRDSRCHHAGMGCVVEVMNEIYRTLVPGGWLLTATPSSDGRGAFQDPTHCSFWNPNSFWYYTREQQRKFVPGIKARFQAARVQQKFPTAWHEQHNIPYVYADLCALKGQRQPGIVEV